jgi:hypothetical protein
VLVEERAVFPPRLHRRLGKRAAGNEHFGGLADDLHYPVHGRPGDHQRDRHPDYLHGERSDPDRRKGASRQARGRRAANAMASDAHRPTSGPPRNNRMGRAGHPTIMQAQRSGSNSQRAAARSNTIRPPMTVMSG